MPNDYNSDSAADRLSAVRAAIARCLTSQEYQTGGRHQKMAKLSELRQMERELMREVDNANAGGFTLGQIDNHRF